MAKPKILISILTDEDTKQVEFGENLLRFFFSNRLLSPEFASNFEPINKPIAKESDAISYWSGNPFFCRKKHRIVSQLSVHHTGKFGSGAIIFDAMYVDKFNWMNLFKELILISKAHYGYLHLITDYERDNSELQQEDAYSFFLGAFPTSIKGGMAELAWANYFGTRWSEFIDSDFLTKNSAEMDSVLGGNLLSVTNSIDDLISNYQIFNETRRILKGSFRGGFFRTGV
ncbi:hypothetical protein [Asticcacaulis solisilvae]|uniref:hypothetical protein n=1 Tax=Asticcacaulis solisilvae TaxID=1217274 RepID=UPI003FD8114A